MSQSTYSLPVREITAESVIDKMDELISEEAVQFIYNGIPHLVMMCTPVDLEDLVYGFSLTEGIVNSANQIYSVNVEESNSGIRLNIEIDSLMFSRLEKVKRHMSARTGCGICGVEDLMLVERSLPKLIENANEITFESIQKALQQSAQYQLLGNKTGASHAAFLCDEFGAIMLVREDVGRHVALDKLIGSCIRDRVAASKHFVLMTSRASFEIIQKTVVANISTLVTMSAPTAKAVKLADKSGLALFGFARNGRINQYKLDRK